MTANPTLRITRAIDLQGYALVQELSQANAQHRVLGVMGIITSDVVTVDNTVMDTSQWRERGKVRHPVLPDRL